MTIYESFIERVQKGGRFKVDIKSKTLKVNNTKLIDNGQYDGELIHISEDEDIMEQLLFLFQKYKVSTPSERSDKHKQIFKAKTLDELTDMELICGESRELAQAELEAFVLCTILSGDLTYPNGDKWFWKSNIELDLILLKSWFE